MTLGVLLDAGADCAILDATVEALRLGDEVSFDVQHEQRGHAGGTRVVVETRHQVERALPELRAAIAAAGLPDDVRRPALAAFERLARAEARLRGPRVPGSPPRAWWRGYPGRPGRRFLA